jgi:DNA-directed RNA polymerase specialized sigma24 family protein
VPSSSDKELLEQFAAARSNRAFAELVERHLGMVYAVALRRTGGDSVLAQEISQQVFIDLARKAGQLLDHPSLVAWLHRTTFFRAAPLHPQGGP